MLVLGVGIILYLLSIEVKLLPEGHLQDIIGRSRFEKKIRDLKDHYIICGYGRVGSTVACELESRGIETLVIGKENIPTVERNWLQAQADKALA